MALDEGRLNALSTHALHEKYRQNFPLFGFLDSLADSPPSLSDSPGRQGPSPPIPKSANAMIAHAHANPWSGSMHPHHRPFEFAIGQSPTEWQSQVQSLPSRRSSPPPTRPKSLAAPPTPPKATSTTEAMYGTSVAVATHPRMERTLPIWSTNFGTRRSAACEAKCATCKSWRTKYAVSLIAHTEKNWKRTATKNTAQLSKLGCHAPAAAAATDPTARHSAAARLLVRVAGMTSTYGS